MKKSKLISLVLINAALAGCSSHKEPHHNDVFMRSDTTASYSPANCYNNNNGFWMWYYAFRPYGMYYGNSYHMQGFYSGAIPESANMGHNTSKSTSRGGFGGRSYSVSS